MENWLGSRIKALRTIKGITQEQLAEYCNVSPSCVSRWETGSLYPRRDSLGILASALEVDEKDFFDSLSEPLSDNLMVKEYAIVVEKLDKDEQQYFLRVLHEYLTMKHRKQDND